MFSHKAKETKKEPTELLQTIAKLLPTCGLYNKKVKQLAFHLGKELDKPDCADLRNQAREIFFQSFFDTNWNYKGAEEYLNIRSNDVLFHILPGVGAYCQSTKINHWVLNKLNKLKEKATPVNQVETLSEFCHIIATIEAYRIRRDYYPDQPLQKTIQELMDVNSKISDVREFLNYELDKSKIVKNLFDLIKAAPPESITDIRQVYCDIRPR